MNPKIVQNLKNLCNEEPPMLISRVRLHWREIEAALWHGHTLRRVHRSFVESGIAISYSLLSRYVTRLRCEETAGRESADQRTAKRNLVGTSCIEVETSEVKSVKDPMANIRELLIRNRPGFQYEGGNPDLSKLI